MTTKTFRVGSATVTVDAGTCRTRFDDGTEVFAAPNYDDESVERARSLGHRDVEEMTEVHDLTHSLVAVSRGWPHSKVLWALAHDLPSPPEADDEERLALLVQRVATPESIYSVVAGRAA